MAKKKAKSKLLNTRQLIGAPAGIRTPNQQIMRRFEGHQQGETKRDNPIFTESAAVKVRYISLSQPTWSRHFHAIPNPGISFSRTQKPQGYETDWKHEAHVLENPITARTVSIIMWELLSLGDRALVSKRPLWSASS